MRAAANRIAEATVERDYVRRASQLERYGESGRTYYRQDILHNVTALAAALDADDPAMFLRYVAWLKIVLVNRNVACDDIAESLRCMSLALGNDVSGDNSLAVSFVRAALAQIDAMPNDVSSFLDESRDDHVIARRCLESLLRLDAAAAREILETGIAAGLTLARIYSGILPPLMREIGRLWQINEISAAHEHYCSSAVQSILAGFYRTIFAAVPRSGNSVLVTCVESEQHEIGARSLADVFELNGWRASYLGANLPSRELVSLIRQARQKPDLIALSATMPAHLARIASTVAAIRDSSDIPIMVGGFLFNGNRDLAMKFGADGYAEDAGEAIAVANSLLRHVS